jgi:hypothetical protein
MNRLEKLSDSRLSKRLKMLRQKERATTIDILLHLIEVERRKMHLAEGYSSMFDYCRRGLGYSESASNRRVKTVRCIRDFPEVYELLLEGKVNLSTISRVARILTDENKAALLFQIQRKSQNEVEAIVSSYHPQSYVRDRVRPVATKKSAPAEAPLLSKPTSDGACKKWQESYRRSGGNKVDTSQGNAVDTRELQEVEQLFEVKCAIDLEGKEMLDEIKVLLSTKFGHGAPLGELMKTIMRYYLDHHSPKRKKERREKRQQQSKQPREQSISHSISPLPYATRCM